MKNTKNKIDNKNKITERVFANENVSIEDILKKYINNKVDKLINKGYANEEIRAISNETKEVA